MTNSDRPDDGLCPFGVQRSAVDEIVVGPRLWIDRRDGEAVRARRGARRDLDVVAAGGVALGAPQPGSGRSE